MPNGKNLRKYVTNIGRLNRPVANKGKIIKGPKDYFVNYLF
jgi:hypothetical protein